ncbi:hypothetical protein V6N13_020598 [Hibiscus sabdariffa]
MLARLDNNVLAARFGSGGRRLDGMAASGAVLGQESVLRLRVMGNVNGVLGLFGSTTWLHDNGGSVTWRWLSRGGGVAAVKVADG